MWVGEPPVISNAKPLVEGHKVLTFDFLTLPHVNQMLALIERTDKWHASHVTTENPGTSVKRTTHRNQSQVSVYTNSTRDQLLFCEWFKCLREPVAGMLGLDPAVLVWSEIAQYQRSVNGNFFNWHRDPSPKHPLKAIVICYLSDAESHDLVGGTTDFMLDGKPVPVEPRRGRCVTFDPNILHRGAPVLGGTKYAFTFGWV